MHVSPLSAVDTARQLVGMLKPRQIAEDQSSRMLQRLPSRGCNMVQYLRGLLDLYNGLRLVFLQRSVVVRVAALAP